MENVGSIESDGTMETETWLESDVAMEKVGSIKSDGTMETETWLESDGVTEA